MLCTYCRQEVSPEKATKDHVIARSWCVASPASMPKWKVIACNGCNNKYSAIEKNLLERMALVLDPSNPALKPVVERARRAINPKFGKTPKDALLRQKKREAILGSLKSLKSPNEPGVLPFGKKNFFLGSRTGISVPGRALKDLIKKWILGIHLCEMGKTVPVDAEVLVHLVTDEVAQEAFKDLMVHAKVIRKDYGAEVLIAHAEEDGRSVTLYGFNLWNSFRAYGSVDHTTVSF